MIHIYVHKVIQIYIYIDDHVGQRERERERDIWF